MSSRGVRRKTKTTNRKTNAVDSPALTRRRCRPTVPMTKTMSRDLRWSPKVLLAISAIAGIIETETSPIKKRPEKIRQIIPSVLLAFSLIQISPRLSFPCRTTFLNSLHIFSDFTLLTSKESTKKGQKPAGRSSLRIIRNTPWINSAGLIGWPNYSRRLGDCHASLPVTISSRKALQTDKRPDHGLQEGGGNPKGIAVTLQSWLWRSPTTYRGPRLGAGYKVSLFLWERAG